ncbi:MAG: hypothetical protein H6811_11845 [Phycisphaeraceae bacterium]|nr:hypothetical protein [Phycisphaeraceae bacterium]
MAKATGKPLPKKSREAEAVLGDPARWFVQPGFPGLRVALIAGGVLALAALLAAVSLAREHHTAIAAATLYETLLHTGTGLVAVIAAAWLTQRGFNEPGLAAARILVPVGAFEFVSHLDIPIPSRIDEFVLAAAAYFGLLWGVFRLPKYETAVLAGSHFLLWLLIQIGTALNQLAHPAATAG